VIRRVIEYVAADRALAKVYIADLEAGGSESAAWDAANTRAYDAEDALPSWLVRPTEWIAERINQRLYLRAWELEDALDGHGRLYDPQPGTAEAKIEERAATLIANRIYAQRYGDSTEFAGERMDECDVLTIDILDELAEHGLTLTYAAERDQHGGETDG
jgi:hypothetical protein